jgi:hypothetical protein
MAKYAPTLVTHLLMPLFPLSSLSLPPYPLGRYWITDLQGKVADECVQLHGGWGYMWEFPGASHLRLMSA